MNAHQFCRDICLERGEPHEGTGDAPERMLLLPWPRGKWRIPRWESVGMGAKLSAAIRHALNNDVHLALVDRVGETDSLPGLMAQPESVFADFGSEAELVAAVRNYTDGIMFEGEVDPRVTILVCTDSRRDACCARYGFSTYKALTADADPMRFNIVQATHVGGCRFAASLIVMPQRQRYGRMTAGQAPAFLESILRNEVFLPAYKGRADQREPMQVAEIAAFRWAEEHHRSARHVRILQTATPADAQDGHVLTVQAAIRETDLDIRLTARTFLVQGNCETVAENSSVSMLRWCLDGVTARDTSQKAQEETS
jgi:hypothetical protein